MHIWQKLVV